MSNQTRPAACAISPHDLLAIAGAGDLVEEPPAWVREALIRSPLVVVRRAPLENGLIPVGVRGAHRGERFAARLPANRVMERIAPESLTEKQAWNKAARARDLPHFGVLRDVAEIFAETGLRWGPVGGVGFELASGRPCLTPSSDIDLLLRAPAPLARSVARRAHERLSTLPVRIDVQVEIPAGALALAEYASGADRIVLRTMAGPRLVANPWEEVR